ncbi:MAG: hypothetical protein OXI55_05910 [Gammaproteobacteria bacterium]|nr:hypothetical protein [Gammaproteobacteria bacterium]
MHEITVESLIDDYLFALRCIRGLDENHFLYLTPRERDAMCGTLVEETRQDHAFKLLALIDAALRNDFHQSRACRRRDPLSMLHRELHTEYRNEVRGNPRSKDVARRIAVARILLALERYASPLSGAAKRDCRVARNYLPFLRWYPERHAPKGPMPFVADPEDLVELHRRLQKRVFDREDVV